MYVIFDSNIWISELGLNSTLGAAVRFFVKSKGATVVLPEVIRLETERNLKAALTKYVTELGKNHRQLLAVFRRLKEMILPEQSAIEEKVASIFGECQLELLEIPLSLDSARQSFMKAIDKIPPSDKDQQFKDGVIWAECVRLLEADDVYLVTEDKAFYKNREYKNGLADALKFEIKDYTHRIYLFNNLSTFLQEIRTEVKLDEEALVSQYWSHNKENVEGILSRNNFAVSGLPKVLAEKYITEDANKLFIEFEITFSCDDLLSIGRTGVLLLKGDCTYFVHENNFCGFRSQGEEITFKTDEGEQKSQNGYFHCDGLVIGHRTIDHAVKFRIED